MTSIAMPVRFGVFGIIVMMMSSCVSLSKPQQIKATALAAAAKTSALSCDRNDHCPAPSFVNLSHQTGSPDAHQQYAMILDQGEDALVARLNIIGAATRQIDIQTYIFDKDDSSRMILDALLVAARRGVKVRLLIDQLSAIEDLNILAALSGIHSNFSIRIYNPTFGKAKLSYFDYARSVLCCFRRFNQRMHNKLLVVDGHIGIVGGRNYQNDYFDWDLDYNFRDRDVLIVGSAVQEMQNSFDSYWLAKRSVRVEQLNDVGRLILKDGVPALPPAQYTQPERVRRVILEAADAEYLQRFFSLHIFPVNNVEYFADLPGKYNRQLLSQKKTLDAELYEIISHAKSQVILQTPYLVISKPAALLFKRLHHADQPPQIIVSTNSLAATDNPIVYTLSYKYKRRNFRELGFNIFEYKPFPRYPPPSLICHAACRLEVKREHDAFRDWSQGQRSAKDGTHDELRAETRFLLATHGSQPLPVKKKGTRMGLHAKSLVVDNSIGVIGTHNFDPRSENYNTEGVVIVRDPAFARALAQSILQDISPENAWTVAPRRRQQCTPDGMGLCVYHDNDFLPIIIWPWRYVTDYEFQLSSACPAQLFWNDLRFFDCAVAVGDFPDVNVGPKWLFVHMLSAFGAGLVPIL